MTENKSVVRPSGKAAALRLLAQRRLTEAELFRRLCAKGYEEEEVLALVACCKSAGYLDDAQYARLFVEGRAKPVGDARMVAELVRRGIAREAAIASVAQAEQSEEHRLEAALDKIFRTRPSIGYPSAARALERLGFSTPGIYRALRKRALPEEHVEDSA